MAAQKRRPRAQDFLDGSGSEEQSAKRPENEEEASDLDPSDDEDISGSEIDATTSPAGSDDDSASEDNDEPDASDQIKSVSFGALARAQDSLARKRKRDVDTDAAQKEDKLGDFRARLAELKRQKLESASSAKSSKRTRRDSTSSNSSSGSAPSEADTKPRSRSSKHAPASQSTKYQVTRKREVIDVPKRHIRDPRFGPLPGSKVNKTHASKAYSFLQSYADGEMKELRTAIKKTKDEDDKTTLRRKLMSMENQKRARQDKELVAEVEREHRRAEKEAVAAGKKPHYLKKTERDRLVQVKRYEGMTEGQREKVIEKRRRKEGQKEKKMMPNARRIAG